MQEPSRMLPLIDAQNASRKSRFPFERLAKGICMIVALGLSAGCRESNSQQQSRAIDTAVKREPQPRSTAELHPVDSSKAKSTASDMGFSRTWQPKASATLPVTPKALATPVAAQSTTVDDDRYGKITALPAVETRSTGVKPAPKKASPGLESRSTDAGVLNAATEEPDRPVGNPLRNQRFAASAGRPKSVPSTEPPLGGDPVPAVPASPSAEPRPPEVNPGLPNLPKPEGTAAGPSTAPDVTAKPIQPAVPAAPSTATTDHSLDKARPGPRTNKNSGIPFDPIKENGPIFVGWPKPKLALVITGQQEGYLEPCGCAGLDRMKGGMSRRYTLFKSLRDKGWPVVGMDVGGTAKGFGKQAEIKFQIAVNSMNAMRYSSAALGKSDLQLPTEEVLSQVMPANAQAKTMFVSGNVGLFAFDEKMLPRTQLISAGFKKIGVTAILGKTYQQQLAGNTNLVMIDSEKLLDEAAPMLKGRSGYMVLLAHATRNEALALAKKYPDFNLVVCSDGGAEPPGQPEEINKDGTKLIEVGEKGMYAVVIGLFDDPKQPMRYQRVTLDSRFKSSPEMIALMSAYQDQLKEMGLSGLGIRPLPHPLQATNGDYVGSAACQNCHEQSYRIWKKTPHSHAFEKLQKATPPREFDPECISCHVVGWNPQKFFPYKSGYLSQKETPKLLNVGCEDCHGPGATHCWAENHGTKTDQQAARIAVRLTEEEAANPNCPKQNCFSCHDLDNSPEFKFNLYFPFVKHYERE
jgi:hypothetical protein